MNKAKSTGSDSKERQKQGAPAKTSEETGVKMHPRCSYSEPNRPPPPRLVETHFARTRHPAFAAFTHTRIGTAGTAQIASPRPFNARSADIDHRHRARDGDHCHLAGRRLSHHAWNIGVRRHVHLDDDFRDALFLWSHICECTCVVQDVGIPGDQIARSRIDGSAAHHHRIHSRLSKQVGLRPAVRDLRTTL